jgi:hypothetical protein
MNWVLSSPLLVMHESSLQMQACASQIYKEYYIMLKLRHRQARYPQLEHKHHQQDRKGHTSKWHSHDQNEAFFTIIPSHEHRTYTWSKWAQTKNNSQTSWKVTNSHHQVITNIYKLSHVMSKPPSHVSTSRYETSHWWTSCNGLAPKIKNLKHLWHGSTFSNIGISHTIFMIYKLSMVHEVPLRQKEA